MVIILPISLSCGVTRRARGTPRYDVNKTHYRYGLAFLALFAVCARHRGRERRHDRHEQGLGDEPSETLFPHPDFPTSLGFTKSPP